MWPLGVVELEIVSDSLAGCARTAVVGEIDFFVLERTPSSASGAPFQIFPQRVKRTGNLPCNSRDCCSCNRGAGTERLDGQFRAIFVEPWPQMADFRDCRTSRAVELATDDEAATDAGADGDIEDTAGSSSCSSISAVSRAATNTTRSSS